MICKKCGNEIPQNKNFCIYCGEPFNQIEIIEDELTDTVDFEVPKFTSNIDNNTDVAEDEFSYLDDDQSDNLEIEKIADGEASIGSLLESNEPITISDIELPNLKKVSNNLNNSSLLNEILTPEDVGGDYPKLSSIMDGPVNNDFREKLAGNDFVGFDEKDLSKQFMLSKRDVSDRLRSRKDYTFLIVLICFIIILGVGFIFIYKSISFKQSFPEEIVKPIIDVDDDTEEKLLLESLKKRGITISNNDNVSIDNFDFIIPIKMRYKKSDEFIIIGNGYYKIYFKCINNNFDYYLNNQIILNDKLSLNYEVLKIDKYVYDENVNYLLMDVKTGDNLLQYVLAKLSENYTLECVISAINDTYYYDAYELINKIISSSSAINILVDCDEFYFDVPIDLEDYFS